jgi:hypothetical protein
VGPPRAGAVRLTPAVQTAQAPQQESRNEGRRRRRRWPSSPAATRRTGLAQRAPRARTASAARRSAAARKRRRPEQLRQSLTDCVSGAPSVTACRLHAEPSGEWVTQQARDLGLDFSDHGARFLIRDRDSQYGAFDEVFRSEGIRIVKTPVRARERTRLRSASSYRPLRVPRLAADPEPTPPRARRPHLRRALQAREAATCARPAHGRGDECQRAARLRRDSPS